MLGGGARPGDGLVHQLGEIGRGEIDLEATGLDAAGVEKVGDSVSTRRRLASMSPTYFICLAFSGPDAGSQSISSMT